MIVLGAIFVAGAIAATAILSLKAHRVHPAQVKGRLLAPTQVGASSVQSEMQD